MSRAEGHHRFAVLLAVAVAAAALAAPAAGGQVANPLPPAAPANPIVNGGFEACSPSEASTTAFAPAAARGNVVCPPWFARTTSPTTGGIPFSQTSGVLLGQGGRLGVLRAVYDDRDGVLLIQQRITPGVVSWYGKAQTVTFDARADRQVTLGFHVLQPDGQGGTVQAPALGSPIVVPGTNQWLRYTLHLPFYETLVGVGFEVHPCSCKGATIELDNVEVHGAVVLVRFLP